MLFLEKTKYLKLLKPYIVYNLEKQNGGGIHMFRKIFDSYNNPMWLLIGIVGFAIGLLISYMIPVFYSMTRFQGDMTIGYSPNGSSIYYQILAFFMLALGFYFIYKFSNKSARVLGGLAGFIMFAIVSIFSYNSYTHVHADYLEIGKGYTVLKYSYDEIEELYLDEENDVQYFELVAKDGKKFEVVFGGLLNSASMNHIRRTLESYGLKMIDLR